MAKFQAVTHVIFDVDGLLLDTEGLYTKIMQSIAEPHGKTFTWGLKVKQMGKKMQEAGKIFIEELGLPITVDEYCRQVEAGTKRMFPEAELLPGAAKLVKHLHKHNIPIAVATGSPKDEYEMKTARHQDVFSLFSHGVFSSCDPEVKHGKPAPDCFLVCAKRFNQPPDPVKVLVFEDAPNGAEGGVAAGMQVVWIPDPNVDKGQLQDRVTQTLTSLEEFKPELFGLPPYDS